MSETAAERPDEREAVAVYKSLFKAVLESRPSGMRLRLAHAIGKNRSFVSQIANPSYHTPIPAQHLNTIFEVCHFSPAEKAAFLTAYGRAHPNRAESLGGARPERTVTLQVPDLGNAKKNRRLDAFLNEMTRSLAALLREEK